MTHLGRQVSGASGSLVLLLLLVRGGRGYPGGAPDMACLSMLPTGHGVGPQTSDPPYSIFVSKKSYKPGETLQVVVQAEGEDYFRGILLQARMIGCEVNETKVVGVFTNTDSELETRHCFGEVHSAVSHNSARKKRLKTFYWTAPVVSSGHVVMRATIVRDLLTYWSPVESHLVADLQATVSPRCTPDIPTLPDLTAMEPVQPSPRPQVPPSPGITLLPGTTTEQNPQQRTGLLTSPQTTVKSPDQTKREEQIKEKGMEERSEENLPSWLGPTFNKESPKMPKEMEDGDSSWLIPAYQKAAMTSSSVSVVRDWVHESAVVIISVMWVLLVH